MIRFTLKRKVVVLVMAGLVVVAGLLVAPFDWHLGDLERYPVAVDAIPDIGENQQIVFVRWPGRSPRDIEDQITHPLSAALLGVAGVVTVRSTSMFGFSSIYLIFGEDVDFYAARSRILEKLNSLPPNTLPAGVKPALGPDATPLGQVFWYTLEGRDERGRPSGGWDLHELRSIQDWYVRYALMSVEGVAEVASVGGHVKEYQVDVDPHALRAYGVTLDEVIAAVRDSNLDVGAKSIEINKVEYLLRGVGFVKTVDHLAQAVVAVQNHVPVRISDVAHVSLGPADRRGVLDRGGAETVGGVVVTRYGTNPLQVIERVKKKIAEIAPGLPQKELSDGRKSRVTIVSFYDRTELIHETLDTLGRALKLEVLVTILVILLMLLHLKSALMVSGLLPLAVLLTFVAMKLFAVDANIVALSGIAIAIGTMVDMAIVLTENILVKLRYRPPGADPAEAVFLATREVAPAVVTAVATTVISFLPVFVLGGAEGKLFTPLAYTKTFALIAALTVSLTTIPPLALLLHRWRLDRGNRRLFLAPALVLIGAAITIFGSVWLGLVVVTVGLFHFLRHAFSLRLRRWIGRASLLALAAGAVFYLARVWRVLGPEHPVWQNSVFIAALLGTLLVTFGLFYVFYGAILRFFLNHKGLFSAIVFAALSLGVLIWQGGPTVFGWLPSSAESRVVASRLGHYLNRTFPGLGKEFMPPLDEGAFLFMPSTMPHASIGEAYDIMRKQNMAISRIPEVSTAVGKLGRADSPLDPAPLSMIETIINYKSEFYSDKRGRRATYKYDSDAVGWVRDRVGHRLLAPDGKPYKVRGIYSRRKDGTLIPDSEGRPFRQWRPPLDPALNGKRQAWPGIRGPRDIWQVIVARAKVPGATSAPFLQPISARLVMLQSGMRAAMGIKVKGPDLKVLEHFTLQLEKALKQVAVIDPDSVVADRIVGKPYLEIRIDREAIARYGISMAKVQKVIAYGIGGGQVTTTVEGRQRYGVRVRYLRELRDHPEAIGRMLVAAADGTQIPLQSLAEIKYVRGPQAIKSEDNFLVSYVTFGKKNPAAPQVDVVAAVRAHLQRQIRSGELVVPDRVSFAFAGSYENQVRSERRLMLVLPVALAVIFIIVYLQFRSTALALIVFSGVLTAAAGGFFALWLYSQSWFLDFPVLGTSLRQLFGIHPYNLSVAVWVGFLALFGIATDNGVVMATFLQKTHAKYDVYNKAEIRQLVLRVARKRLRPLLMTTATTLLALIPVLTSSGRGSDIMIPMAIPTFGGMLFQFLTLLMVPVLYAFVVETRLWWQKLHHIN